MPISLWPFRTFPMIFSLLVLTFFYPSLYCLKNYCMKYEICAYGWSNTCSEHGCMFCLDYTKYNVLGRAWESNSVKMFNMFCFKCNNFQICGNWSPLKYFLAAHLSPDTAETAAAAAETLLGWQKNKLSIQGFKWGEIKFYCFLNLSSCVFLFPFYNQAATQNADNNLIKTMILCVMNFYVLWSSFIFSQRLIYFKQWPSFPHFCNWKLIKCPSSSSYKWFGHQCNDANIEMEW